VQDELREREQEVASLTAAVKSYEAQFDGLQTILIAKVSQCNRLAGEVKDICKQLRQAEVAAASDHASMTHQLEQLSDRVAELEDDLAEEKQRGEQLEVQLAATSAKVCTGCAAIVSTACQVCVWQALQAVNVPFVGWAGAYGPTGPTKQAPSISAPLSMRLPSLSGNDCRLPGL
jgi:septal ring factor EnvC (AmiA/AmiB activator)